MATMSFADMLKEAGQSPLTLPAFRYENLGKLIRQHGVDYNGLIDVIKGSTFLPNQASINKRVRTFLKEFEEDIPKGGIDATPEQIEEIVSDPDVKMSVEFAPFFKNIAPSHMKQMGWRNNIKQALAADDLTEMLKRPEFRKEMIAASVEGAESGMKNWHSPLVLMPDMSPEDAKYVASKLKPHHLTNACSQDSMPLEMNKEYLRGMESQGFLAFPDNGPVVEAAAELAHSPNESPELKNLINGFVIRNIGSMSTYASSEHMKPYYDILKGIPPEALEKALGGGGVNNHHVIKKLNNVDFSPEQNAVVDEWARQNNLGTVARFIHTGRAQELSPQELSDIMVDYLLRLDESGGHTTYHDAAKESQMTAAIGLMPKEKIDKIVQVLNVNRDPSGNYSDRILGMWKYLNPRGESLSDEQFQNEVEQSKSFLMNKFELDRGMRLDGAKTSIVSSDDLNKLAEQGVDPETAMQMLIHPNLTKEGFYTIHRETNNPSFDRVFEGMADTPNRTGKFKSIIDNTYGNRVDARIGSTALRHLRDHLDERAAEGVASLRPEELPKGRTFNTLTRAVTDKKGNVQHVLDWNPLRDNRAGGNLTSDKVRQAIDSMPVRSVLVKPTRPWKGMQNHTSKGTEVMQFIPSPEAMQKIKDAGLWTAFGEMSLDHMTDGTSHPTAPFHMGWIRYSPDHSGNEIFIDEIQSDLHSSFRKLMKEPNNKLKDQMQSVMDILFGKHHPSEVMHEAFHQHLRDNSMVGYKVHIHGVKSKAKMSLRKPNEEVPVHFKEGYDAIPKKMGYTPAEYGDLDVETGDGDTKAPDLFGMQTHGTKVVKFEEMLFELSKGEW